MSHIQQNVSLQTKIFRSAILVVTLSFSLILEFYVRRFNMWDVIPYVDSVMHFFWGINVFLLCIWWLKWKPADAVFGIFVFQMFWELTEMIGDIYLPQIPGLLDHFFFDGIKDTVLTVAGGVLAWVLLTNHHVEFEVDHKYLLLRIFFVIMMPLIIIGSYVFLVTKESPDLLAIYWIGFAIPITLVTALVSRDKI